MQMQLARLKFIEILNEIETKKSKVWKNIYMSSNMTS